jgi:sRNA-binding protein
MTSVQIPSIEFTNNRIQNCSIVIDDNVFNVVYENKKYIVTKGQPGVGKETSPTVETNKDTENKETAAEKKKAEREKKKAEREEKKKAEEEMKKAEEEMKKAEEEKPKVKVSVNKKPPEEVVTVPKMSMLGELKLRVGQKGFGLKQTYKGVQMKD